MSQSTPSGPKEFKRINFFKGFLTTEQDWNDAEAYHIEKRKLHNRLFHAPGVVMGMGDDLRVVARARGDLSVEVQAGYAVDGQGNDLVLWDAEIKSVNADEYRLPQTVYVVLRFTEELTDFIAYKENLDFKGHRRVKEGARVEISQTEPDIMREVEIARIYLDRDVKSLRDARDPENPQANEIDLRYVPKAGVAGARLSPALRMRLESVIWQMRKAFREYTRRGVVTGYEVVQATSTALMLATSNQLDLQNVFQVFYLLVEGEAEVCLDVDAHHPKLAQHSEFADLKRHVEILRGLLAEGKETHEALTNLLAYQTKASEAALRAVSGEAPAIEVPKEEPKEQKPAEISDWESVKTTPTPEPRLELEGISWVLVDEIDILDKESEEKHEFSIKEAKDSYRSRQKLKYPDGTVVEDTGRAHVGGHATYKILNLTPGRPVAIVRRMDYVYGDYELAFEVEGRSATVVSCTGTDRIYRWRNWPALIDAEHVTATTMSVKQVPVTAGRDVNMFHIWVYQPA